MPKLNNRAHESTSQRLARRINQPEDPKRLALLGKILEESSSISLNDGTSQLSARQAIDSHAKLFELLEELIELEAPINPKLPCRNKRENWNKFFKWIDQELCANNEAENQNLSIKLDVVKQVPSSIRAKTSISNQTQIDADESSNTNQDKNSVVLDNVGNESLEDDEYSLVAKVPFSKGEKIFNINRKVMLTTETATKDSDLFDFIANDSIASGMQNVVLVLHLLNEYSKQERSYWWPYLSILPNKLLPILTLDKDELKYLLASSHLCEGLKMIRAIARQYTYFYKRLQATKLPLKKDFTFAYYAWGVSIVCSRQNEIPTLDRQACVSPIVHALIPMLDMCNHDSQSNQATFEKNSSCLIASKELNANDEITINYGCRSSGDFFIHNGFVPERVHSDLVPLVIALNKQQDVLAETKAKLLKILNMPSCGRFKLIENTHENRHKRDPHLTMFLIVYFMSKEELEFVLADSNPVGIADEIYEFVQYKSTSNNYIDDQPQLVNQQCQKDGKEPKVSLGTMKIRSASNIQDYLSKRALISVAIIDRVLELYHSRAASDGTHRRNPAIELLKREKSVFKSYIRNGEKLAGCKK